MSQNIYKRTTRRLSKFEEYEYIQKNIDNLELRIYFNYKYSLYRCVIQDGSNKYESTEFILNSHYQDGLIQDIIGEIESTNFFNTFGCKTQHHIKKELTKLIKSN